MTIRNDWNPPALAFNQSTALREAWANPTAAWLRMQTDLIEDFGDLMEGWIDRRRQGVEAARETVEKMGQADDMGQVLQLYSDWTNGFLGRIQEDTRAVGEKSSQMMQTMICGAQAVAQRSSDAARQTAEQGSQMTRQAADQGSRMTRQAADQASSTVRQAADEGVKAAHQAADQGNRAAQAGASEARQAAQGNGQSQDQQRPHG